MFEQPNNKSAVRVFRKLSVIVLLLMLLGTAAVAMAATYDEGSDGDLSGDRTNPTSFAITPGSNVLTGSVISGDLDYVTIDVPAGGELTAINLNGYNSTDNIAFIGVQTGTTFTEPADTANVANILGWVHFGSGLVGTDVLDDMGNGMNAIGFSGPLTAGSYTFWIQQTSGNLTDYTFDFQMSVSPLSGSIDEANDGDLSGDRLNPTGFDLALGNNPISGNTQSGDLDYVTVTVPENSELSMITLDAYTSTDQIAFIGVQTGTTFTEPADTANVANILGWVHFGSGLVGTDVLDDMGNGPNAIGFSSPLAAGTYTFWIQQTGTSFTEYDFNFVVTEKTTNPVSNADYDEVRDGDLSGDRLNPTPFSVSLGSNTVSATSVDGDLEYLTITVPDQTELSMITLDAYTSTDQIAFIAVQTGTTFTVDAGSAAPSDLLGWVHFGPSGTPVGTDMLDDMGQGPGAIGFTGALPAGSYTFWMQQTSTATTSYILDFVITEVGATSPTTTTVFLPIVVSN